MFALYLNQGNNSFQRILIPLPGNVIDTEFVDLNYDGLKETFLVLTETGGQGAFSYALDFVEYSGGGLFFSKNRVQVGFPKVTSLDFFDINGDGYGDFVLSVNTSNGSALSGGILYFAGNSVGDLQLNNWGNLSLPAPKPGFGDHIESLKSADLDLDGYPELIVLRGYSNAGAGGQVSPTQVDLADLIVYPGSATGIAIGSQPIVMGLPGKYHPTWSTYGVSGYMGYPLRPAPNMVRVIDLAGDGVPDVILHGLSNVVGGRGVSGPIVIKNLLDGSSIVGSGVKKVGEASGDPSLAPARMGFDGGAPVAGNNQFGVTVQNLPAGSLASLMWGGYAQENLIPIYSINIHLGPEVFSNLTIVGGYGETFGFQKISLPIPNQPALRGFAGYFQVNYFHAPTNRLGATQALGLYLD